MDFPLNDPRELAKVPERLAYLSRVPAPQHMRDSRVRRSGPVRAVGVVHRHDVGDEFRWPNEAIVVGHHGQAAGRLDQKHRMVDVADADGLRRHDRPIIDCAGPIGCRGPDHLEAGRVLHERNAMRRPPPLRRFLRQGRPGYHEGDGDQRQQRASHRAPPFPPYDRGKGSWPPAAATAGRPDCAVSTADIGRVHALRPDQVLDGYMRASVQQPPAGASPRWRFGCGQRRDRLKSRSLPMILPNRSMGSGNTMVETCRWRCRSGR